MRYEVKYEVRDYTMEQQGFANDYTSDLFDTYEEALNEEEKLKAQDRALGIQDEYYIKQVFIEVR